MLKPLLELLPVSGVVNCNKILFSEKVCPKLHDLGSIW